MTSPSVVFSLGCNELVNFILNGQKLSLFTGSPVLSGVGPFEEKLISVYG